MTGRDRGLLTVHVAQYSGRLVGSLPTAVSSGVMMVLLAVEFVGFSGVKAGVHEVGVGRLRSPVLQKSVSQHRNIQPCITSPRLMKEAFFVSHKSACWLHIELIPHSFSRYAICWLSFVVTCICTKEQRSNPTPSVQVTEEGLDKQSLKVAPEEQP